MYDLLTASLTCQRWYQATKHPEFRKRITIYNTFPDTKKYSKSAIPVNLLLASSRIYENIRFSNARLINRYDLVFFQYRGRDIKYLSLEYEEINDELLLELLNCLPSLEVLVIRSFSERNIPNILNFNFDEVPEGLKNLKSLKLLDKYYREDVIGSITKIIPNLEEFEMKVQTYGSRLGLEFTFQTSLKKYDCLNFLKQYRKSLKTLNVSKCFCDNLFDNGPVIIDELDLKELHLQPSTNNISRAFEFILSQKNLTTLEVRCNALKAEQLTLICERLDKLESLTISGNVIPSESIKKITNLKALELSSTFVDILSLQKAISDNHNKTLQVLTIELPLIDKNFLPLISNLTNLRMLTLTFNRMQVDMFQLISKYLVHLERLEIIWRGYQYQKELPYNLLENEWRFYNLGCLSKLKSLRLRFPVDYIPGFSLSHLMKLKNLTSLLFLQTDPITLFDQKRLMHSLPLLEDVYFLFLRGINKKLILANGPRLNRLSKYRLQLEIDPEMINRM